MKCSALLFVSLLPTLTFAATPDTCKPLDKKLKNREAICQQIVNEDLQLIRQIAIARIERHAALENGRLDLVKEKDTQIDSIDEQNDCNFNKVHLILNYFFNPNAADTDLVNAVVHAEYHRSRHAFEEGVIAHTVLDSHAQLTYPEDDRQPVYLGGGAPDPKSKDALVKRAGLLDDSRNTLLSLCAPRK